MDRIKIGYPLLKQTVLSDPIFEVHIDNEHI